MSKQKRSQYTTEFKEKAVKLALESNKTQAQVARDLGIDQQLLYNWINKYRDSEKQGFDTKADKQSMEQELKRLRAELAEKEEENEILKKAAAYFAKHSQ